KRLWPLTRHIPKALLPIAGKPIIDFIIEEMIKVREIESISDRIPSRLPEGEERPGRSRAFYRVVAPPGRSIWFCFRWSLVRYRLF
ncbi:sugar phosphate nucleotidyltransferase, partial [Dehalococcoidia bacterium]|nr:sugar phosphate nucleotidyltransferase [Dehalococcoidia bacterium]